MLVEWYHLPLLCIYPQVTALLLAPHPFTPPIYTYITSPLPADHPPLLLPLLLLLFDRRCCCAPLVWPRFGHHVNSSSLIIAPHLRFAQHATSPALPAIFCCCLSFLPTKFLCCVDVLIRSKTPRRGARRLCYDTSCIPRSPPAFPVSQPSTTHFPVPRSLASSDHPSLYTSLSARVAHVRRYSRWVVLVQRSRYPSEPMYMTVVQP